jgi:dienelactone hydrolase
VLRLSLKKNIFSLDSIYEQVGNHTIMVAPDGDLADLYYPVLPNSPPARLPIALMLQGAFVDRADYSNYAKKVASYGLIVVVPNRERTITGLDGNAMTGLFADEQQVSNVLAQMKLEDADAASPIFESIDIGKLGLLGHSFGAYAGLAAIQDINIPSVSTGNFMRPPELKAGIFFGASFQTPPYSGMFPQINNQGIPIGLIAGTLDGIAKFENVAATYDNIQCPPKALIAIEGANHYSITNYDSKSDPTRPTLEQSTAIEAIGRWSGLFLRANLLNDQDAIDYLFSRGNQLDPDVTVISQMP